MGCGYCSRQINARKIGGLQRRMFRVFDSDASEALVVAGELGMGAESGGDRGRK